MVVTTHLLHIYNMCIIEHVSESTQNESESESTDVCYEFDKYLHIDGAIYYFSVTEFMMKLWFCVLQKTM